MNAAMLFRGHRMKNLFTLSGCFGHHAPVCEGRRAAGARDSARAGEALGGRSRAQAGDFARRGVQVARAACLQHKGAREYARLAF